MTDAKDSITIAIAWCLAWGEGRKPQYDVEYLQKMRLDLSQGREVSEEVRSLVGQVDKIQNQNLPFPKNIAELQENYRDIWNQKTPIGLVYGGATKIKGYVFESAKLQEIRGASAILDRINLVDLKAFFGDPKRYPSTSKWLHKHFPRQGKNPGLEDALIPELIIYSTGGNILAFCPAAYIDDLANAIERRYTEETLTANSCAVGETFRLLELQFGLLRDPLEETKWLDWYLDNKTNPLVEAYFGTPEPGESWEKLFENRKSFNELAGRLAALFNQRRNGNDLDGDRPLRPSRRYPPMFETHPYLVRDESDVRSAITQAEALPKEPFFSESLARKRIVGQRTKFEDRKNQSWFRKTGLLWRTGLVESWVTRFKLFFKDSERQKTYYQSLPSDVPWYKVREARTLEDIAKSSGEHSGVGFVAYIYGDGNNMGGYIQKIRTPHEYQEFSRDIFEATEKSVYAAIAKHLSPRKLENPTDPESQKLNTWVHPFEIIAIGGDDVMLIVPADKGLEIASAIGEEFERRLPAKYQLSADKQDSKSVDCHRYRPEEAELSQCVLSMSIGVLIADYNTPIYYAQNLTEQLLKSAKKRAKELKERYNYYGGTVDFVVMKSVTAISSAIGKFRDEGLTKDIKQNQKVKLYSAPYTLHELGGLVETVQAMKQSGFPRSQLYQIRSLLERGKNTAILNYRYFRVRLGDKEQTLLRDRFEEAWCQAKTNNGNLAPWMFDDENKVYETIWRELVDLHPFVEAKETAETSSLQPETEANR